MMIDFGEAVRRFYGNYTTPHGRSQRSAFWWVILFQVIIYGVLFVVMFMATGSGELLDALLGGDEGSAEIAFAEYGASGKLALFLAVIFGLVNFLPNIMLEIRRFHDLGQTGWWVLAFRVASVMPLIGNVSGIANLIWFAFPGTTGPNKYGPDPLQPNKDVFG